MELVGLTFIICLLSSVMSGMGGGGGGFITMPYFLFIGLAPANAIATSKLGSIGTTAGSMMAFHGKGYVNKKLAYPFMAITLVASLLSAWLIPKINPAFFEDIIAVTLLVLIPTLFIKKAAFQPGGRSKSFIIIGFVLYAIFTFLQTLLGAGLGSMLVIILMFLFGLGALEAHATKRVAQAVQAILLFILLAFQGLIMWTHGVAALIGSTIGCHIGSRVAIKRGEVFVKYVLAIVMLTSGIALLMT